MHRQLLRATFALALTGTVLAQDRFATSVVQFNQGTGSGIFSTGNILGGPRGGGFSGGSLDVLTLGTGGDVTLGFDVTITDGPGADFTVFENGFAFSTGVFAEVAFVEVSTDGTTFARFPTRYFGDPGPLPAFGTVKFAGFEGLAGGLPGIANVDNNSISPFDPVVSGGEAFDLAELENVPEVVSGAVDPAEIHFVRLVDMVAGTETDSVGNLIWDNGGPAGNADIDAVAVIQHQGNQSPTAPKIDLWIDDQGFCRCELSDPNGRGDIDFANTFLSVDLEVRPFFEMRTFFELASISPTTIELVTRQPVAGGPFESVLAVSGQDFSGQFSGDQITLHP
ncbi:MAG: hypothetical protein AAFU73_13590 [Planctomycetota bacterium]